MKGTLTAEQTLNVLHIGLAHDGDDVGLVERLAGNLSPTELATLLVLSMRRCNRLTQNNGETKE